MKLSEYIKNLQQFLKENGDLECYFSSDDEGNNYQKVGYAGTLFYVMQEYPYQTGSVYSPEDVEDYPDDHFYPICVVN